MVKLNWGRNCSASTQARTVRLELPMQTLCLRGNLLSLNCMPVQQEEGCHFSTELSTVAIMENNALSVWPLNLTVHWVRSCQVAFDICLVLQTLVLMVRCQSAEGHAYNDEFKDHLTIA